MNTIDKEKMKVVDIFFEMYPELKKNKEEIMFNVFEKNLLLYKYIFTKHIYKNTDMYIDPYGLILDKNLVFKGFVVDKKFYMCDDDDIKLLDIDKLNEIMKL